MCYRSNPKYDVNYVNNRRYLEDNDTKPKG